MRQVSRAASSCLRSRGLVTPTLPLLALATALVVPALPTSQHQSHTGLTGLRPAVATLATTTQGTVTLSSSSSLIGRAGSLTLRAVLTRATHARSIRFTLSGFSGTPTIDGVRGLPRGGRLLRRGSALTYLAPTTTALAGGATIALTVRGMTASGAPGWRSATAIGLLDSGGHVVTALPASSAVLFNASMKAQVTLSSRGRGVSGTGLAVVATTASAGRVDRLTLQVPTAALGAATVASSNLPAGSLRARGSQAVYLFDQPHTYPAGAVLRLNLAGVANPTAPVAVASVSTSFPGGTPRDVASYRLTQSTAACGSFRSPTAIASENARAGTSTWRVATRARGISGWADHVSAACGESVLLYVRTLDPTYHVEVYRMGWYGGSLGRLVARTGELPRVLQRSTTAEAGTQLVETTWRPTAALTVGADWPPGDYLLKLVGSGGTSSMVPLTVTDPGSTSRYALVNAVLTWQAYNDWGGYSLYHGYSDVWGEDRARVVSFDRPYAADMRHSFGDGQFISDELPLVSFVERHGYDVSYLTDVDVDAQPDLLQRHRAVMTPMHSEYWTEGMRTSFTTARDSGTNLAVLGSNNSYWRARLAPDRLGRPGRREVVVRYLEEQPTATAQDATVRWRDAPVSRPEQELFGTMYDCLGMKADASVVRPESWILKGTSLAAGATLPLVVQGEADHYWPGQGPDVEVLAHADFPCTARDGSPSSWDLSYYTAPDGAGVFSAGTMTWVSALNPGVGPYPVSAQVATAIQTITLNVLDGFGQGPAGLTHPAQPNSQAVYPSAEPTPAPTQTTPDPQGSPTTSPTPADGSSEVTPATEPPTAEPQTSPTP